jgi:PAS domain S-box-containing protein
MSPTQMTAVRRLETLYDTLNQGVVFFDRDGKIVSTNPAAASLLGRRFLDLNEIPPDDPEICALGEDEQLLPVERYPAMVAARTGARVRNFVMGIFNPVLKQRRWFSVDACPIHETGDAEPSGAYAIFTDITERRAAERELRQSKLHLALAQRITSVGSAAVDFRTGKWDWSDETFRIYGVDKNNFTPSAEQLGKLVHPDDWPELYSNVPRARQGLDPAPVAEYRIKRPDGAERILRRIATTVKDEAGNVSGIVATVQDVTELRMAQRENQALQSQLYHAQRLDALGTLAGGIAHDLNNTLVPVVALSDALLRSLGADDPHRPLMELIQEGGQRSAELVAQILAFARREVTEYELINLSEFLQQMLRLIRASVPKSIRIVEDLAATAKVSGNKGQLHQVLLNLFSNAAQAIGDDPGHIYLSTLEIDDPRLAGESGKHFIQISVADTGCGMSEEVQAHIFEPFFTTKRVGTGSGLGLSVAHGIVASHGGEIRVKSGPGEGSRFDVLLPVAVA